MNVFEWPVRVYIEDTDAGGIVYYVNYLKYMERARTEYMRAQGFDRRYIFTEDLMFVVHQADIRYRLPARLDDELQVQVRITDHRAARLQFEQRIVRDGEEICLGQITVACVDMDTLKPRRIPPNLLAALTAD